jgi:hypothetical protein
MEVIEPTQEIEHASELGHRKHCVPIALQMVTGCTIEQAHTALVATLCRRDKKTGTHCRNLHRAVERLGYRAILLINGAYGHQIGMSLVKFSRMFNRGRYIVTTSKHGLAVVEGTIYDHGKHPRARVLKVWAIYHPSEQMPEQLPHADQPAATLKAVERAAHANERYIPAPLARRIASDLAREQHTAAALAKWPPYQPSTERPEEPQRLAASEPARPRRILPLNPPTPSLF